MVRISVFDFDGTIANTIPIGITILRRLVASDFHKVVDDEMIKTLRDKPIPEIFRALNIPLLKLPFIANKARTELNREIEKLKPIKGMKNVLLTLKERGQILGIVSSNSRESIEKFLKENNLEVFDFIYTSSQVFGKANTLKKLFSEFKSTKNEIAYFGDEIRDIEAAHKVGIKIVSVTWGVNSREKLASLSPDFIVDDPAGILTLFQSKSL